MSKPSAIIAKLEDCPNWLDQTLAKAYWEADYLLEALDLKSKKNWVFRFGASSPALERELAKFEVQRFAIVTAFNPGSVVLPLEENLLRHEHLRKRLTPHCRLLRNSTGQNPKGEWQELGFWVLDIDLELAADIGLEFGQHAIVCWQTGGKAELWWP